ncbi:MAG: DUF2917 domain-containing protein [Gemmatimonadota bacterium]
MDSNLQHAVTRLERGALLRLNDVDGRNVAVCSGTVWITQDRDPRDVFVGPGETFRIDRPGLVLVQAIDDASLLVLTREVAQDGDERALA